MKNKDVDVVDDSIVYVSEKGLMKKEKENIDKLIQAIAFVSNVDNVTDILPAMFQKPEAGFIGLAISEVACSATSFLLFAIFGYTYCCSLRYKSDLNMPTIWLFTLFFSNIFACLGGGMLLMYELKEEERNDLLEKIAGGFIMFSKVLHPLASNIVSTQTFFTVPKNENGGSLIPEDEEETSENKDSEKKEQVRRF